MMSLMLHCSHSGLVLLGSVFMAGTVFPGEGAFWLMPGAGQLYISCVLGRVDPGIGQFCVPCPSADSYSHHDVCGLC